MSTEEPAVYWTFTFTCQTCGETVQVTEGKREPHPCPDDGPAIVIEGCDSNEDLKARVERALDDLQALEAMEDRNA